MFSTDFEALSPAQGSLGKGHPGAAWPRRSVEPDAEQGDSVAGGEGAWGHTGGIAWDPSPILRCLALLRARVQPLRFTCLILFKLFFEVRKTCVESH